MTTTGRKRWRKLQRVNRRTNYNSQLPYDDSCTSNKAHLLLQGLLENFTSKKITDFGLPEPVAETPRPRILSITSCSGVLREAAPPHLFFLSGFNLNFFLKYYDILRVRIPFSARFSPTMEDRWILRRTTRPPPKKMTPQIWHPTGGFVALFEQYFQQ